jgi:hypothetical protein
VNAPRWRRRRSLLVAAGLIGVILTPPVAPARRAAAEWARRRRSFGDPVAPFLEAPCQAGAETTEPIASGAEATQ